METEELITALERPGFWPQPGEVETIETLLSFLFLVGERAYKLKKPVELGFVDFSTLEKRKFYCEEELRLNRRLAPDLYLGVREITGPGGAPEFEGSGETIDYVVEMRRFDQADLMEKAEKEGRLDGEHLDQLAEVVAGFHGHCPPSGSDEHYGAPDEVSRPMEENFRHLFQGGMSREWETRLVRLREWSREEHRVLSELFQKRRSRGRIRECHGDLHLGNMLLQGDRVAVFDCIEFNRDLRWIDVLSDVAFCAMDLSSRGRDGLAFRFLNGYLEKTGDYDGLPVLPYYLVYRAMVRAKVAWLQMRENSETEKGKELRELWSGYLALAERCAFHRQPELIVMHGVSGTGKSYGSGLIIQHVGAIRIRSDIERKRVASETGTRELYSGEMNRRTYDRLFAAASDGLKAGFAVVLDATFLRQDGRAEARKMARHHNVPCRFVTLTAKIATLKERIRHRTQTADDPSDADIGILEKQLSNYEPLTRDERRHAIEVDTERPGCWEEAVEKLGGGGK